MSGENGSPPALTVEGRPLRVLHIGNVGNNAFNNAKVQRRAGIEADVLCPDYYHIMGTPEWEDADFESFPGDHFFPEWHKVNLNGYRRPEWFIQGRLPLCARYLAARNRGRPLVARLRRLQLRFSNWLVCRYRDASRAQLTSRFFNEWPMFPVRLATDFCAQASARLSRPGFQRLRFRVAVILLLLPLYQAFSLCLALFLVLLPGFTFTFAQLKRAAEAVDSRLRKWRRQPAHPLSREAFRRRCEQLVQEWAHAFPDREPLNRAGLDEFYFAWRDYSRVLPSYDVVQGYATDVIWPLLCGCERFTAFEHGTVRNLREGRTVVEQLACLGYRKSCTAFVTNGDCLQPARRLGIPRIQPSLHGIDDSKFHPYPGLRQQLLARFDVDRVYLCPLRHDWAIKGTDKYIRALPAIIDRTGPSFRLVMTPWGGQTEESRRLARELCVEEYIVWQDPLPRRALARWYGAVDCVFDQIALPHFGGTAPEAMGCGAPVIMSYDPPAAAWIVAEPAPILSAWTVEAIVAHVVALQDVHYHAEVSRRGREWFERNHSSRRSLADHLAAYRHALGLVPGGESQCA
jgi:glycosyltransferase involved in cell wall biosynthesis